MQERYDLHSYRSELTVIQNTTTGATVLVSRGDSYGDEPNPGACETRTYPPDFNSTTCALAPSLRPKKVACSAPAVPPCALLTALAV